LRVRFHLVDVEIDQVGVIHVAALAGVDAVGIMAGGAGGSVIDDVQSMGGKGVIAENGGPTVALVTESIAADVLTFPIGDGVFSLQ
jgi:hypothetical protein